MLRAYACCLSLIALVGGVVVQAGEAHAAPTLWSITPSPDPGSGGNTLEGVSCTSATHCVAVGLTRNGSVFQNLVETWDGTNWSVTPSPRPGGSDQDSLVGVSCVSASYCVAVGGYDSGGFHTLVETWNGTSWSVTPSPNRGSTNNYLSGVSCTSATHCVAVGGHSNRFNESRTLAEVWNGTSWSLTPSPSPGPTSSPNNLHGVSCTSTTHCVAVGGFGGPTSQDPGKTLVETWNGTSWSLTPSPNKGSDGFGGVSCVSASYCVAVGGFRKSASQVPSKTLVETWNGTSWSVIPSPNEASDGLSGVSCTSTTDCVAVGGFQPTSQDPFKTLVETWNGTSWSIASSPNPGGSSDTADLHGVSCTSPAFCVAVSTVFSGTPPMTGTRTLIETGSPASVGVSPPSGPPSTSVTASGRGFSPAETAKVIYKTGLSSPPSVVLCTATVLSDGTFSCTGQIPSGATAGALGAHKIVAKGATSKAKAETTFTLT